MAAQNFNCHNTVDAKSRMRKTEFTVALLIGHSRKTNINLEFKLFFFVQELLKLLKQLI